MKRIILIVTPFILLIATWIFLRMTHRVDVYNVPTTGMEPTINAGEIIFASSMKNYGRGSIIAYKEFYMYNSGARGQKPFPYVGIMTHRVIGIGGDIVELHGGYAYVNGKPVDTNYEIQLMYKIPRQLYDEFSDSIKVNKSDVVEKDEFMVAPLTDKEVNVFPQKPIREEDREGIENISVAQRFPMTGWNFDYWGPYIVPEDSLFVLGDNRNRSFDSRMRGCISPDSIVSVLFRK